MKLIIAGSRSIASFESVVDGFEESPFSWEDVDVLVNGDADGVDSIAGEIGELVCDVEVSYYPADEFFEDAPHPTVAPILRNQAMAENADALLAVWDGDSSGTKDMIEKGKEEGLHVFVYRTDMSSTATSLDDF